MIYQLSFAFVHLSQNQTRPNRSSSSTGGLLGQPLDGEDARQGQLLLQVAQDSQFAEPILSCILKGKKADSILIISPLAKHLQHLLCKMFNISLDRGDEGRQQQEMVGQLASILISVVNVNTHPVHDMTSSHQSKTICAAVFPVISNNVDLGGDPILIRWSPPCSTTPASRALSEQVGEADSSLQPAERWAPHKEMQI